MAEDRAAVDGSYLSALPDKPPRWNTTIPEALSASEGSGQGVPACSNAVPEAQPLTGELRDDPTTSHDGLVVGIQLHYILNRFNQSVQPKIITPRVECAVYLIELSVTRRNGSRCIYIRQ